jgi:hypothetical protein
VEQTVNGTFNLVDLGGSEHTPNKGFGVQDKAFSALADVIQGSLLLTKKKKKYYLFLFYIPFFFSYSFQEYLIVSIYPTKIASSLIYCNLAYLVMFVILFSIIYYY